EAATASRPSMRSAGWPGVVGGLGVPGVSAAAPPPPPPQAARPLRKGTAARPAPVLSAVRRLGWRAIAWSTRVVRCGLREGLETPAFSSWVWISVMRCCSCRLEKTRSKPDRGLFKADAVALTASSHALEVARGVHAVMQDADDGDAIRRGAEKDVVSLHARHPVTGPDVVARMASVRALRELCTHLLD